MNIKMPPTALSGQFRMVVSEDADGKRVKHDTGFFDNLITDVGMHRIGGFTGGVNNTSTISFFIALCGRFVVGSGQTLPAITDTALQAPVAFASSDPQLEAESSNYERGWYEITVRHQFGQGQAAGNLSEIGIQRSSASGPLWSRALILDVSGNPTTITVLPSDFLTCYYTLRIMIPKEDAVFNIDVDYDEDGIVPTVVTARPLGANDATIYRWGLCSGTTNTASANSLRAYSGGLSAPTSTSPLGSSRGTLGDPSFTPYDPVNAPFKRWATQSAGLSDLNASDMSTFSVPYLMGCWQINFNPPLQKNNTQTMQLTFGYSWARA